MSDYRGKYSGSGKSPLADGNCLEDAKQDTGKQKQPAGQDWAGSRTAKEPSRGNRYLGESDADPRADDKQFWGR